MSDRPRHLTYSATTRTSCAAPDDALRRLAALMGATLAREIAGKTHPTEEPTSGSPGTSHGLHEDGG